MEKPLVLQFLFMVTTPGAYEPEGQEVLQNSRVPCEGDLLDFRLARRKGLAQQVARLYEHRRTEAPLVDFTLRDAKRKDIRSLLRQRGGLRSNQDEQRDKRKVLTGALLEGPEIQESDGFT